jgi:hypothetical protein
MNVVGALPRFAGIGTQHFMDEGRVEIQQLFERSFGEPRR